MYNTQNDNKKDNNNNTFGPYFINEDDNKRLAVSFWDRYLTIKINDGAKDADGLFKAIDNSGAKLNIALSTVSSLVSELEEIYDDLKHGKDFEPTAIPCGVSSSNLIEITDGSNIGLPKGLYLVIYKDIQDDRTSKGLTYYSFSSRTVVKSYIYKTGSAKSVKNNIQEFKEFMVALREFSKSMTMASAHAIKEATKYEKFSTYKTLGIIATSMGIDLMKSGNSDKRRPARTPLFENNNSSSSSDDRSLVLNPESFSTIEYVNYDDFN